MVVEDEAIIARDIQMQLTSFGFAVTGTPRTAADTFQQIERDSPDIVLMDISIAGDVDGVAAAEVVRTRYGLPVIYLTAHTDAATIERARLTEPFGYIVKPLGNTNMKPLITMALNKHKIERQIEYHRKMLSMILQGLPGAVLVAEPSGKILFLNQAAEHLTGWTKEEAAGKGFAEVASLEDGQGRAISFQLVREAIAKNATVRLPRGSALIARDRRAIDVAGQLAVSRGANGEPAGVFITLQDVTAERAEEQRLQQERQMLVAGELAHGVAQEFYALASLIGDYAQAIASAGNSGIEMIQQASQIGRDMSLQLMDLRETYGSSHAVNVGQYLLGSLPLLERFCRAGIAVGVSAEPAAGYVLSTGNHFEQLLMHLCLNGRHFLNGSGKITITAGTHQETVSLSRGRSYARLAFLAEKLHAQPAQDADPAASRFPDVNLSIVRAIAIASEGFSRAAETSDASLVEVFLPRHASRESATAAANEYSRIVLLAGVPGEFADAVKRAAGQDVAVFEASGLDEASLISELYPGDFDLMVVNETAAITERKERLYQRMQARRPAAGLLRISGLTPAELEQQVASFFQDAALRSLRLGVLARDS
jgi:PAS domain S-box-containing protein